MKDEHQTAQHQIGELHNLRKQLRDSQDELQQTEERLKQHSQLTSANSATMEEELCNLRKQLHNSQTELQQTEQRLKQELKHMQGQLTSANSATMEALEGRMTEMQRKHAAVVAKLKQQHELERLEWNERQNDDDGRNAEIVEQAVLVRAN